MQTSRHDACHELFDGAGSPEPEAPLAVPVLRRERQLFHQERLPKIFALPIMTARSTWRLICARVRRGHRAINPLIGGGSKQAVAFVIASGSPPVEVQVWL